MRDGVAEGGAGCLPGLDALRVGLPATPEPGPRLGRGRGWHSGSISDRLAPMVSSVFSFIFYFAFFIYFWSLFICLFLSF